MSSGSSGSSGVDLTYGQLTSPEPEAHCNNHVGVAIVSASAAQVDTASRKEPTFQSKP